MINRKFEESGQSNTIINTTNKKAKGLTKHDTLQYMIIVHTL